MRTQRHSNANRANWLWSGSEASRRRAAHASEPAEDARVLVCCEVGSEGHLQRQGISDCKKGGWVGCEGRTNVDVTLPALAHRCVNKVDAVDCVFCLKTVCWEQARPLHRGGCGGAWNARAPTGTAYMDS